MGTSTNAILAYGIDLGEDWPEQWRHDAYEFDEMLAERAGICYANYHEDHYDEYSRAKCEFLKTCPVELIVHCSDNYPMYFLAVRGTEIQASRGDPAQVDCERLLQITAAQHQAFIKFCQDEGLDVEEPSWHLFSMWN